MVTYPNSPLAIKRDKTKLLFFYLLKEEKEKESSVIQIHYDLLEQLQLYERTLDSPFFQSSLSKS